MPRLTPSQLSSNDLLADRRADYAEMLFSAGDHAAAAELMTGALELAPNWALGWYRLGEMQEAAGSLDAATVAWRTSLRLDPADRAGATLKLQLIGASPLGDTPPSAFVEALFDQYADKFDHALVETLHYRVPILLATAIAATGRRQFDHAVDLGCGTGLMGVKLRPVAQKLDGYDISAEMLRKARDKGVYDRLVKADLQELEPEGEAVDLVTAADVFMYLGALDRVFSSVMKMLAPGGVFAFSVERFAGEGAFELQGSRRYAHSEAYVHGLIAAAGLKLVSLERAVIRQDRREPVEGLIVVTERLV